MKKTLSVLAGLLAVLLLCACGTQPLPDWADADTLREKSIALLDLYHTGQFNELTDAFHEDVRAALSNDVWADSYAQYVEPGGTFLGYADEMQTLGQKADDGMYATAVITAEYEKCSIVYTISFAEGYAPVGLRIAGISEKK